MKKIYLSLLEFYDEKSVIIITEFIYDLINHVICVYDIT